MGEIVASRVFSHFRADGEGVLDETLTIPSGFDWRILAIKLHVTVTPATAEDFVVQIRDPSQNRNDVVLLTQDMNTVSDVVRHYEGLAMSVLAGQTVDFDWANTDENPWGLIVTYLED